MLYMVIERYHGHGKAVYDRFHERGRMLPDGLEYVASWTEPGGDLCFQVMKCEDESLLHVWAKNWLDLDVEFEFIPVLSSQEMSDKMKSSS